jgi:hypothetical protein
VQNYYNYVNLYLSTVKLLSFFLDSIYSLLNLRWSDKTTPTYLYYGLNNAIQDLSYFYRKRQDLQLGKVMAVLIVLSLLNCFAVATGGIKGETQCTSSQI